VKSNFTFFVGLFAGLGISWLGIVIGSNAQLGALAPYYDDGQGSTFPEWMPGIAARGQLVYRDLGCAACHTQQVRRPSFGSDSARGWGDRQSVARDYIYQPFPQLGLSRTGPDLANLGGRKPTAPDEGDLLTMLYKGSEGMPSYRFLFEERQVGSGAQPSDEALQLTGALKPKAGVEIVPTARAVALVAYLLDSKTDYDYPEAVPLPAAKAKDDKTPAAAPAVSGPATPAAATAAASPTPASGAAPAAGASPVPAASPTPAAGAAPAGGASPVPAASPTPTSGGAPAPAAASPTPAAGSTPVPAAPAPGATPTPTATGKTAAPAAASPSPVAAGATPTPTGGAH
jgi:cytochrome c oxidase cbb3-type subunit II